ncbi:MAG: YkgJ family cysteine cluster protein [Myxococcota bacterium]|nr:YkgJ family cysteine cluster protein [Myxococcota bacterium]
MASAPIGLFPDPSGGDCVACGRCCHHEPRTVHLLDTDDARVLTVTDGPEILRRLTVLEPHPPGWRFMANTGERCAALDVSRARLYPCAIYAVRPDDCRIVEPGSPACLEARALGHLGSSVEYERR